MTTTRDRRTVSRSAEDYLKTVYALQEDGGSAVHTTHLAARLQVAPPSVTNMVARLARDGLLRHTPYRGVELTPRGTQIALTMVRRHRLLETFLFQTLGIPLDRLHAEAERLEHDLSDELASYISRALGEPTHDPHGAPIPAAEGSITLQPPMRA